jgi:hypothetical protein
MVNTPANSLHRVTFFTLAGVENASLEGQQIVGRWTDPLQNFPGRQGRLIEDFANWSDDAEAILRFTRRYGPLREEARPGAEFRFALDGWRFDQHRFRVAWEHLRPRPGTTIVLGSYIGTASSHGWTYLDGSLSFRAASLWEYLLLSLMASPQNQVRRCAQPDCEHPYFVARHPKQNYCSTPCARWGQSKWKRNWWTEHGKTWRKERQTRQRRKRR